MLREEYDLLYPKPGKRKKRLRHKQSILHTEKNTCFLCAFLYGDRGYKQTEEHYILFGSGQRKISEAEGFKVNLCLEHHRIGPDAVHNNQSMRNLLCRIVQKEYEKTHTREEWMWLIGRNYLE